MSDQITTMFASSWRSLLMYVLVFILIWNYVIKPVNKKQENGQEKKMRNDYGIRPRDKMMKGGKAMTKNKKSKKADMLTAKMSKDKKGRAMAKGKR